MGRMRGRGMLRLARVGVKYAVGPSRVYAWRGSVAGEDGWRRDGGREGGAKHSEREDASNQASACLNGSPGRSGERVCVGKCTSVGDVSRRGRRAAEGHHASCIMGGERADMSVGVDTESSGRALGIALYLQGVGGAVRGAQMGGEKPGKEKGWARGAVHERGWAAWKAAKGV